MALCVAWVAHVSLKYVLLETWFRGPARCLVLGWLLALLKYPFYPLFILDNGMNLISKSLTVLTRPNYWSFSHLHIYFGGTLFLQVFGLFWSMKWRGPWSSANAEKDEGQIPKEGPKPMLIRSPFMHIHPPREPKGPNPRRWDQDTSGLSKANEDLRKDSLSYPFLEDISKITTSKGVQSWRT